jgi:two-component sensor histidine kinase
MMGHDLRNLVSAFDQNLEFVLQSLEEMVPAPPQTVFEDLTQVAGASARVMSYVHRIHQLAHIVQGPWSPVAPDATLGRVLVSMQEGGAADGRVRSHVADDLPDIRVDMNHANVIVKELVDNAQQAGAHHIRLSLCRAEEVHPDLVDWATGLPVGDWVALQCEDDGVGMDAFLLTRCVEPLVFHPDAKDRSGLGFSIIRGVLRAVGGRLGVVSRSGSGTTVVVAIPAAGHPSPGPGGGTRVVVPEASRVRVAVRLDNAGFAEWVRELLGDIQVTVTEDPQIAEVLIADRQGAMAHPGRPCGMFFIGSGWPPGVPRPDAVMMPTPDREGFIRRLSMAVTRSRTS